MVYGYDHWNLNVQASLPGVVIAIADHPIPDGTNLFAMYGTPNCVGDCDYYSDESAFLALLNDQTYTKREKYWDISTNLFDNLWTEYSFAAASASCGDVNNPTSCTPDLTDLLYWDIEAVAITEASETEYYEAMVHVPILGLPHGDYVFLRYDPT